MPTETAYAKVNLALHVRSRRPDGYHEIESLFAFCEHGDDLSAEARSDGAFSLRVEGPFADDLGEVADNLVLRAANALQQASGTTFGADIVLEKYLPVASGIGGGSADAAAALRLLARIWNVDAESVDLHGIAASLGADVPACLASRTLFGSGVGEALEPCELDLAGTPILLVNPLVPCPTGSVFKGWDGVDRGPLDSAQWRLSRNDLAAPARALVPEIDEVLAVLRAQIPQLVRMSGSGATCFALFGSEDERDAAADRIEDDQPDWWLMTSRLK